MITRIKTIAYALCFPFLVIFAWAIYSLATWGYDE